MTIALRQCPLCGKDNRCGRVRGHPSCWCADVTPPPELLAAIPAGLRGKACLCPGCARGAVPSPCIDVCALDAATRICRGCKRSMTEISGWPGYTAAEKLAVLQRLAARRS